VLIIEDSADDAFLLLRELRRGGYELQSEQVDSPTALNRALDSQSWDLVLSDHAMPGFSALAALDILKARRFDLPFIIVSGNMSEEVAVTAMKAGANDFFVKGNLTRLVPAIERELSEAEVRRAQRRSAEQLHLRQTILECQSEAAPDGILVVSTDKRWLSNNRLFVEMWRLPETITQQQSSDAAFDWMKDQLPDPAPFVRGIQRLNAHPEEESRDEVTLKDGRIFSSYSTPVRSNDGIFYGRVWYYRDITERKRAEQRLAAQYAVTAILAESLSLDEATPRIVQAICESLGWEIGAAWRLERSTQVLAFVNFWAQPGFQAAEFEASIRALTFPIGKGLPGRVWLQKRAAWIPNLAMDDNFSRSPLAARLGLHSAFAFPVQLGSEFLGVMEFFSREIRPPDDALLCMFANISSQIGQAIERGRAEADLRESEARNRAILDSFPDVVFVVDLKRKVLFLNPAAVRLLDFLQLQRQLPPEVDAIVQQVLQTGEDYSPSDFAHTYRVRIQHEDRFFLPRVVAMRRKNGVPFGIVALLQDVTALRLLDSLKSNLIATVSHELKTPMTSLRMALHVMREETVGALNPHQKEMLSIAHGESERLLSTLNNLLDLARFEEGLPMVYLESASPALLVEAAVNEARPAALSKRLDIITEVEESLPALEVDRVRLIHVFTNLLTNAIKHSPKGESILFRVARRNHQWVRFTITDHGPGIPLEYQARIFDKFFRVPGQPRTGTGLGLTIAKEFVKAHQGVLGVTSEPGQGSTFYVDLKIPDSTTAGKPSQ